MFWDYLIYPTKQKLQIKSLVSKYQIKIILKFFCEWGKTLQRTKLLLTYQQINWCYLLVPYKYSDIVPLSTRLNFRMLSHAPHKFLRDTYFGNFISTTGHHGQNLGFFSIETMFIVYWNYIQIYTPFRGDLIQGGHEIHKIKVVLVSNLRW